MAQAIKPPEPIVPKSTKVQSKMADKRGAFPITPAGLAALISSIVDEKLQTLRPAPPAPPQQPLPQQPQQPLQSSPLSLSQPLANPSFVASLLHQPGSATGSLPASSASQASLAAHVPPKTKQAILRGENVEFDSLLPETSTLYDNDLPGVSISFQSKQHNIPSPSRKKKTFIDSVEKWLSAFAIYCTILLTTFPQRAVEMFSYQELIRSTQRKFSGFAWLSYDIDFRRKAASNLALNWGERDIQIYLMKFTGQAKTSCTICGSGDHSSYGCSLSAKTQLSEECATISTEDPSAPKNHALSVTAAKPAMGITPPTATMSPLQSL